MATLGPRGIEKIELLNILTKVVEVAAIKTLNRNWWYRVLKLCRLCNLIGAVQSTFVSYVPIPRVKYISQNDWQKLTNSTSKTILTKTKTTIINISYKKQSLHSLYSTVPIVTFFLILQIYVMNFDKVTLCLVCHHCPSTHQTVMLNKWTVKIGGAYYLQITKTKSSVRQCVNKMLIEPLHAPSFI